MKGTTVAWLTFTAVATYRWEKAHPGTPPMPSIYMGSAALFSILGFLAVPAPGLATAFGWALVVAAGTTGAFIPSPTVTTPNEAGAVAAKSGTTPGVPGRTAVAR